MSKYKNKIQQVKKENLPLVEGLADSNLLMENLLDDMNIMCMKLDIYDRIIFFNKEAEIETETGYSRNEVLGRALEEVLMLTLRRCGVTV